MATGRGAAVAELEPPGGPALPLLARRCARVRDVARGGRRGAREGLLPRRHRRRHAGRVWGAL
eukprot:254697-Chlamydomonas_euryale.AAC.1